ncbi:MAG: molybdate ABC transporter substrate-binding protein [Euryarchaeota archaeon]|nr:molybdate ABC transporter substrate-binding protein [Euryarchaeota archaeon]
MDKLLAIIAGIIMIGAVVAGLYFLNGESSKQVLVVDSGAGLMKPMNELVAMFENQTGTKVQVHYGGSAEIFGELETTGCDVFIPGAYKYTYNAMERGYMLNNTVQNITYHVPVIAVPAGNPKNITSLQDLAKPGVKVVLGDPNACAIGKVAKKILEKNDLWTNVSKNVVTYTPTANQLLIYISMGQADAAIIWEDMTTWAQAHGKVKVVHIPKNENLIKTIPTGVTVYAEKDGHLTAAEEFNKFIIQHKEIWEKWGFQPCS